VSLQPRSRIGRESTHRLSIHLQTWVIRHKIDIFIISTFENSMYEIPFDV
jgi:hypothetical protein